MDYLPVRTVTLRKGSTPSFEIFIHLDQKYIAYLHKGTLIDDDRLLSLEKKGVKKMYILADEEDSYLAYLDESLNDLKRTEVPTEEKAKLAQASITSEAEHIESTLESEDAYKKARKRMLKVSDFFSSDSNAIKMVLAQMGLSSGNTGHAANVATLSIGVAVAVGIDDPEELFELGIASLCHDLGKEKLGLPADVTAKNLPKDQRETYWKHPSASALGLGGKKYITAWVLKLIEDHHEIGSGDGFPNKKTIDSLDEASQILNLCNDFDSYSIENKMPHPEAFKPWKTERAKLFMDDHIEALGKLIATG